MRQDWFWIVSFAPIIMPLVLLERACSWLSRCGYLEMNGVSGKLLQNFLPQSSTRGENKERGSVLGNYFQVQGEGMVSG